MRHAIECTVVAVCLLMVATTTVGSTTTTVYDDTLASPFQDWSWAAVNFSYTNIVHNGSKSISFLPISWQELYIRATDYIDTSYFTGLQFWVYRPTNASTQVNFEMVYDSSGTGTATSGPIPTLTELLGGSWPANTWLKVYVSFSAYDGEVYDGFRIADESKSSTNPPIYIDDIVLINGATSTPAATTKAPSPVTTPSPSNVDAQVAALYTTSTVGQASFSGYYNNAGSCGLDPTPASGGYPVVYTVSLGNYLNSRVCGMCLLVSGFSSPPYSRMVFVNNQYRGASANLAIQTPGNGVFNISYKGVPCPVTIGIQYLLKSVSGPKYIAIMAQNTVYPVYKFAILVGGNWAYFTRQSNNLFVITFSGQGVAWPYTIQMTSIKGEVITDVIENPSVWGWAPGQGDTLIFSDVQFTP